MNSEEEIKKATDQVEFRVSVMAKIDDLHACVDRLDKRFFEFNQGMGKRMDDMQRILMEHTIVMPDLKSGVDDWRDTKKWLTRIVVGAVIAALLGLVLIKK